MATKVKERGGFVVFRGCYEAMSWSARAVAKPMSGGMELVLNHSVMCTGVCAVLVLLGF